MFGNHGALHFANAACQWRGDAVEMAERERVPPGWRADETIAPSLGEG
jgi:hypothetical protein